LGAPYAPALYFFGGPIGRVYGARYLLGLYLAGGVVGSATHVGQGKVNTARHVVG
jgi:membrane associated rhomboid family serine protease